MLRRMSLDHSSFHCWVNSIFVVPRASGKPFQPVMRRPLASARNFHQITWMMSVWRLGNQSWKRCRDCGDGWIRWTSYLFSSIRPIASFKRVSKMETKSYVNNWNWCNWRGEASRPPNAPDPSLWENEGISHELQSVSYLCRLLPWF